MLTLFPEVGFLLRFTSGIWWLGPDEAVVSDSAGALLLRINETSRGEVTLIPEVTGFPRPAVDPFTRRIVWVRNGEIMIRSIDGGPARRIAAIPRPPGSQLRNVRGLGFHGTTILVGQEGIYIPSDGGAASFVAQLLLIREGREPVVLDERRNTHLFGSSAIAYDERSAVIELIDVLPGMPPPVDPNLVKIVFPEPD